MQEKNLTDEELLDLAYSTTYVDSVIHYANMCSSEETRNEILALANECSE